MKLKNILYITLLSIIALSYSCDDSLKNIGFTIQPGSDQITVGTDSLFIKAKTVSVESLLPDGVFAKTKKPILGEYKDPVFGTTKADFACEFYYPEGNKFPDNTISIDSVEVAVFYNSWKGDSIAPLRLSVYEVNKTLPNGRESTSFDPAEHVDLSAPIGRVNFNAANIEVPKAERESPDYYPRAMLNLPKSIGERIYDLSETIDLDTEALKEHFKGLYFTTDFGKGTIVTVDHTYLYIHFKYIDKNGSSLKEDTIKTGAMVLNTTPEVIQINQIQSKNDKLLKESDDYTYIKSPAGVYTEIKFPLTEKADKLNNQALNLAKFKISALPDTNSEHKFKLNPSSYLLLVNKDDLKEFFEERKVPNNITSFYAQLNTTTYTYDFGNLAAMINYYKEKNNGEVKDLNYVLVPIDLEISNINNQPQVTAVYNQMTPTATTISKSSTKMKMELVFSKL